MYVGARIYSRGDFYANFPEQIGRCLFANEYLFNTRLAPRFIPDPRQSDPGIGNLLLLTHQQDRDADNGEIAEPSSKLCKRPTRARWSFRD